jgi:adenosylmethionine-8-amino-7-oxononanoate aminotransferase
VKNGPNSKEIHLAPFTQMEEWLHSDPLVEQLRNFLIDTDGRKYLDGVSSYG